MPLKFVDVGDAVKFFAQSRWLQSVIAVARLSVVGVVGGLNSQVAHALQDGVDLGERTFSGLDDRDAVLGVAGSNVAGR